LADGILIEAAPNEPLNESCPYTVSELNEEFRQGEILSKITQYRFDSGVGEVEAIQHDFVIIASQDCDLHQDFTRITSGNESDLNDVLIFQAFDAKAHKAVLGGSDIWRRVEKNRDDRYQFLEDIPSSCDKVGIGLPALIVDFKRLFSLSTGELRRQCLAQDGASRRCRLTDLYREHFQSRAAFYLQRVALPRQHVFNKQ
jgi:hypothetical protein